mgnify:FL=1|jgi:hypothetical protein
MRSKNGISLLILALVFSLQFLAGFLYYPKWKIDNTEATISWDVSGYYMYLPAIFIYKDLKSCSFKDSIMAKYHPTPDFQQAFIHKSGNYVMKYSSGQAIMLSPAFFIADIYCHLFHKYPRDGFSLPYQFSVWAWCLLISFLGLFILRKILLYYFSDKTVALTIFSIALCSNYFEYSAISGSMSHNTLFTLYALLIFAVLSFYKKPKVFLAIIIGSLCGLATITRPTEIISVFIPILWGISTKNAIQERLCFFKENVLMIAIAIVAFLLVGSIQPIYWKWVSGEWFVYSYGNQGFDWFSPHIYKCLFSAKAGWILYSPMMIFAIMGLFTLYKEWKELFFVCFVFLMLFTYICFSWSEWWYGWSLGQRAMIQSYPMWAIALCSFYEYLFAQKRRIYKYAIYMSLLLGFVYNIWLTHQGHRGGLLKGPEMTRAYFCAIFSKLNIDEATLFLLDNNDIYKSEVKNPTTVYYNSFDKDTSINSLVIDSITGNKVLFLKSEYQFTSEYSFSPKSTANWYKVSADFSAYSKEWDTWRMTQFYIKFYHKDVVIKENMIRVYRVLNDNQSRSIHFFAKKPLEDFDRVSMSLYHANSDKLLYIDNLKVESFDE